MRFFVVVVFNLFFSTAAFASCPLAHLENPFDWGHSEIPREKKPDDAKYFVGKMVAFQNKFGNSDFFKGSVTLKVGKIYNRNTSLISAIDEHDTKTITAEVQEPTCTIYLNRGKFERAVYATKSTGVGLELLLRKTPIWALGK